MLKENGLLYLFRAASLGSMRAASDELDVAPSSISRQIGMLESQLGVSLLEKSRRQVKLTEAGELVCQHYRDRLTQEESLLSKIDALKSINAGVVSIVVGEAFLTKQFRDMLEQFMIEFPRMTINVTVGSTQEIVNEVSDDDAHIGICLDTPQHPKIARRMAINQPIRLIVRKDHAFSNRQSVKLSEISVLPIALPNETYRIRNIIQMAQREDDVFLEPVMKTNSLALITDFILSGRGVSIMPEIVVQAELDEGNLVAVPIENKTLESTKSCLILRSGRELPTGAYELMVRIERFFNQSMRRKK
ncbi:MAG: LysR family transcriptional regulator [Parvularculaceae bacterium]|nr:LysR family transcriptional regulator [Parvularculaceae bacterium]